MLKGLCRLWALQKHLQFTIILILQSKPDLRYTGLVTTQPCTISLEQDSILSVSKHTCRKSQTTVQNSSRDILSGEVDDGGYEVLPDEDGSDGAPVSGGLTNK